MNNHDKPTQRALEPVMVELRKRSTQPTEQLEAVRELQEETLKEIMDDYDSRLLRRLREEKEASASLTRFEPVLFGGGKNWTEASAEQIMSDLDHLTKTTPSWGELYVGGGKTHTIAWGLQQDTSLTLPEQRIAQALGLVALHMRLGAMNTAKAYLSVLATDLRVAKPSPAVARAQDLYVALCDVFYGWDHYAGMGEHAIGRKIDESLLNEVRKPKYW